jgi:hypothetical protein
MSEPDITIEDLEEMVAEKRRRSQEENEARARHIAEIERQREEEREREKRLEEERKNRENGFGADSFYRYNPEKPDFDSQDDNKSDD